MEIIDYKQLFEQEKKKVAVLEQRLATYEEDPEKKGFFALRRIVNQQVDYLRDFTIKDKIGGKASEDATYARSKDMWEGLSKMITDLNGLRRDLGVSSDDDKVEEVKKTNRTTTPESIADSLSSPF